MASKVVKQKKSSVILLHPPYITMISEAICFLKERSGSSHPAIAKYLEMKYKAHLPPNFRKMLSVQLKRFSKSKKLLKVKNSYKLSIPAPKRPVLKAAKSLGRKVGKRKKAKKEGAKGEKKEGAKGEKKEGAKGEKKKATPKKAKSAKATPKKPKSTKATPRKEKSAKASPKKTAKQLKVVKTTQMKKRTVKSPSKKKAAAPKKAKN